MEAALLEPFSIIPVSAPSQTRPTQTNTEFSSPISPARFRALPQTNPSSGRSLQQQREQREWKITRVSGASLLLSSEAAPLQNKLRRSFQRERRNRVEHMGRASAFRAPNSPVFVEWNHHKHSPAWPQEWYGLSLVCTELLDPQTLKTLKLLKYFKT